MMIYLKILNVIVLAILAFGCSELQRCDLSLKLDGRILALYRGEGPKLVAISSRGELYDRNSVIAYFKVQNNGWVPSEAEIVDDGKAALIIERRITSKNQPETADKFRLAIWEVATGKLRNIIPDISVTGGLHGSEVFVARNDELLALNYREGTLREIQSFEQQRIVAIAANDKEGICVGTNGLSIYWLTPRGKLKWTRELGEDAGRISDLRVIPEARCVAVGVNGGISGFSIEDGARLWEIHDGIIGDVYPITSVGKDIFFSDFTRVLLRIEVGRATLHKISPQPSRISALAVVNRTGEMDVGDYDGVISCVNLSAFNYQRSY